MNETQVDDLVEALLRVRRGKHAYWQFIAKAGEGPLLLVGKKEGPLLREAKLARKTATDKRRAAGQVEVDGDKKLTFTMTEGSVKTTVLKKALNKSMPKAYPGLGAAKAWMRDAEVVEEGRAGGGLGIDRRGDAERSSKASDGSHKKLSDYSAFLDKLDDWHREFGDGVDDIAQLSRARSLLDQIEAAAGKWLDSHKKRKLEGKNRKKRRAEVQKVLGQVAEARRTLMRQKMEGYQVSDEDRDALRRSEKTWMDERVEQEVERFGAWKGAAKEAFKSGRYEQGTQLGEAGTFGYAKLFTGDARDPRLVGKFQTDVGKRNDPEDLQKEAGWYKAIGSHPNVARCIGVRTIDGEPCLLMEALEGGDFQHFIDDGRTWVEQGHMSQEEYTGALQHILRGAVRALQHMHESGIYHLDVKPLNIMVDIRTGEAKLIDMGTIGPGTQHATAPYRGDAFVQRDGAQVDGVAVGISTFQALEGDLPDYRPDRVEVSDEDAIRATPGVANDLADLPLTLEHFNQEDLDLVEIVRRRLQKQRAKAKFSERGDSFYEEGEHRATGGLVPWLGEAQKFVNSLLSRDPDERPSLQEMLELPFLDDPMLTEEQAQAVLKRMGELRNTAG